MRRFREIEEDLEEIEEPEVGEILEFRVEEEGAGSRLDQFLSARLPERSRSQIQAWIESGNVMLEQVGNLKPSTRLRVGQAVCLEIPPLEPSVPQPEADIPLEVVYSDSHLLVLNKQRGLVIHPARSNQQGTLVNALLHHCQDLSGIRGVEKPGIVHRLDKDTSGLMVVAKHDQAHHGLSNQFRDRAVLKVYEALVHGHPAQPLGRVNQPIGRHAVDRKRMSVSPKGKTAITDYEVLERFERPYARLSLHIHTGRTHQIRVHMTSLGHPLVGDLIYGRKSNPFGLQGQALHCRKLGFAHPITQKALEFECEPPGVYQDVLRQLRQGGG